ncbi:MAG TPA: serine hydrolase domain-containing protein [Bacteroidota bacterium]|nr:serine hydrolase domain-containing protein [Bacteroidota bacterium]
MKARQFLVFLIILFARTSLSAQVTLPETPQGRTVEEYLKAFNTHDTVGMKNFFLQHVSKEGLSERSAEARVTRTQMFWTDVKSLTPVRVAGTTDNSISVIARNGRGEPLTLTFQFDNNAEHTLAGLGVEMGEQQPVSGPPLSRKAFLDDVKKYLDKQYREQAFSGVVLMQRGKDVLIRQACGDAEKRFHIPNRPDTKFNIGSINKFFTRVAIGQLLESGRLSLEDPVGKILPDYPNAEVSRKVHVQQLLTMQSGMGDIFGDKFDYVAKDKIRTLQDYLPLFVNDSLRFEPGTDQKYSNAGFIVLGLIIEKLSGEDYYSYIRKHVFEPAGMKNSDWYPLSSTTPNLATGYLHPPGNEKEWMSNVHMLPERGSSAGGGYSNADDLRSFAQALLNGKLLSPKYTEWVINGSIPATDPPLPIAEGGVGIAGGTAGVNAVLDFEARTGDVLVVLSNYDPPSAENTAHTLSGFFKRLK